MLLNVEMKMTWLPIMFKIVPNMRHMLQLHILLNIEAKNNKTVVWKKGNMKYDEALLLVKINAERDDRMIWRCASKLRNDIFALQNKQICDPVTVDNIMEGGGIPTDSVKSFYKMLHTGNLSTTEESTDRL